MILNNRVALVTGAATGLGRAHALELARQGAKLVLNDLGPTVHDLADELQRAGFQALAVPGDVTDYAAMQHLAAQAMAQFGQIDILVNNAGIVRDRSFAKMSMDDFRAVLEVHVMGTVHACKAVWPFMQAQSYGRILITTSSSGLYGNFGQANYATAKMALIGLMQTLRHEGLKYDIRVNALAPSAITNMTTGLLSDEAAQVLTADKVSPGLVALVQDNAPNGSILLAGGGSFEAAYITMTQGIHIELPVEKMAMEVCSRLDDVFATEGQHIPQSAWEQSQHELAKAQGDS